MDFGALFQQFGFPVALAIALVYWWRKDYASLVRRVREIEDSRATELKAYANSYQALAERVTEALETHNRLTRHFLDAIGHHHQEDGTNKQSYPNKVVSRSDRFRTPLPFPAETPGRQSDR